MSLEIYNTQTKKKEPFVTLEPNKVKMYVCGPTVYDFLHVGNFRGAIFFNAVRNWLEKSGYEVNYVYNYTDVDDKIINRANELGEDPQALAERYIDEFQKDYARLHLRPHTSNPRVTEYMQNIIDFISSLKEKGHAYVVDSDVYYDVSTFSDYGKLSNKNVEDLASGVRISADERKKNPADFALWKSAKPGEPAWSSPWGKGRPGWHIECSAMSRALLGDSLDIHGGGIDLVFPHHENEIAQSEGCTGHPYVKYWMHNNMLEFGNQKMSKSLGNIRTGRSFLEEYNGEILKYMMLSVHYRSLIDFSEEQIHQAVAQLARIYSALAFAENLMQTEAPLAPVPEEFERLLSEAEEGVEKAMNDDFNTPELMARLFEVTRAFNSFCRKPGKIRPEQKAVAEAYFHWLRDKSKVLALFQEPPAAYLQILDDMLLRQKGLSRSEVDQLVADRSEARLQKDFKKSDEIRDQLVEMGINVQDGVDGSRWEVAK
ncbi:MAG: cysteine--tRNA ligase [Pseudobdellovibrionaceae bacterium]|nr:cysteine--tRNA ligase [Bdellovibrionales bacterium]USN48636.1 MAG: cysteine--tRNA ligase [Pseudobdellovibrionaceae bacterium]